MKHNRQTARDISYAYSARTYSGRAIIKILENICFADYIDRITFQNQIWQFNEMSSLIKTFYNNKLFHEKKKGITEHEIRFTKILTKYSTEYNNQLFIYNMCQQLNMDKKDMYAYFQELQIKHGENFFENVNFINDLFSNTGITNLDIKRIYRFFNKNVKKDDFVYLDPPYAPVDEKSFVNYTTDGFDLSCHNSLFNRIKTDLHKKNIR